MSFCLYVATFLASNSKCSGDHVFLWGQIVYLVVKIKNILIYVWVCVISSCILTILLFWVWVSSPAPLRVPAVKCPADVCQFNVTAGEQWGSKQELEASSFMFRSQDMDARGITILYSSGFTLHVVLCNVTAVLPFLCYVVRTRLAPPPRVLKVCHWVKVARAAGRRGVADKKKKGSHGRAHYWEHSVLSTNPQSHTTRKEFLWFRRPSLTRPLVSVSCTVTITSWIRIPMWASTTTSNSEFSSLVSGVFVTAFEVVTVEFNVSCWEIYSLFLDRRCLRTSEQPSLVRWHFMSI